MLGVQQWSMVYFQRAMDHCTQLNTVLTVLMLSLGRKYGYFSQASRWDVYRCFMHIVAVRFARQHLPGPIVSSQDIIPGCAVCTSESARRPMVFRPPPAPLNVLAAALDMI